MSNMTSQNEDDSELSNCSIFVLGGRVRGRTLGSVEKFTFATGLWELCKPLLENRGSHGATAVCQKVYVSFIDYFFLNES